jgi:hypothetical protein
MYTISLESKLDPRWSAKYERERVLVELLMRRRGLSVAGNSQAFSARSNPPSRLRKTRILVKLWTIRGRLRISP